MTDTTAGRFDGETRNLAAFCSSLDETDIPDQARSEIGTAIVDTVGACVAGVDTPESDRVRAYVRTASPDADAAILGTDEQATPEFAALANGTAAHALEVDDGHRGASAHPGTAVLPAALAVLPIAGTVSGDDLAAAVGAGYEAMLKTGMAVQPSHRERHFHATATLGCLGAAAAAGRLLELDEREFAYALGLAGTQAGGLFEFLADGSMAKRFHPGRAAMAGITAARLATVGFDGPETIIEGEDGFAAAFADEYDPAPLATLGDPFEVTRTYRKPYPCCRHLHAAIDACLAMRDAGLEPSTIERVVVDTYAIAARHDKAAVETILDAQMSMPHAVATALLAGTDEWSAYSDPDVDADLASLRDRVAVTTGAEMDSRYPETRATRVVVETVDGDRLEEAVDYPLGSPENPMSTARLESKFHDLTESRLPEANRRRLLDAAADLSALDDARAIVDAARP